MSKARTGNPLKAVAYIRVSTSEQKLGPEAQRASISSWATAAGVEVVSWHEDLGISGATPLEGRPALAAALNALRPSGAGLFVVAKRDRVARDVGVALAVEKAAERSGAVVHAVDGAGNGVEPADAFLRTIVDAAAAYERAMIRSRTKAALQAKRARGERAGTVPFGFVADADGKLSPCPTEGATVARVASLRAAGATQVAIVAALASEGRLGRSGKPLGLTQVQRLLARA